MVGEFRAAQQRRLAQRGIALWKQEEATQVATAFAPPPVPGKIH
jgi:hypothetical protein